MHKQNLLMMAVVALLFLYGCGYDYPKATNGLTEPPESVSVSQADSVFQKLKYFPNGTQVSIALIRNGTVDFFGVTREKDTLLYARNHNRIFEIGSITKVFTSTLLAGYVTNGELVLDDPVNTLPPCSVNNGLKITFKQLANHTSGLPRLPGNMFIPMLLSMDNSYKDYDEEKLIYYLQKQASLDHEAGTKVAYSNLGVGLLAYALSKHAGLSYEEMCQRKIFDKYHMAASTSLKDRVGSNLVIGLDKHGKPTSNWDLNVLTGAGGIYSSVEDLSKFARAQFDTVNQELALTRMKTFDEDEKKDVGLGWFIIQRDSATTWHWHNGGTGGYRSCIVLDVEKQNGVIVLSNITASHPQSKRVDEVCFALMKTL